MGCLFEEAEREHLKSHEMMRSWSEISSRDLRVKGHKVLNCKWVYVYKFDKHGRFIKAKARLVVRGDEQLKSLTESNYAAIDVYVVGSPTRATRIGMSGSLNQ